MSFHHLPPKYGRILRGILAVSYGFAAYAGFTALVWTPVTVAKAMGPIITTAWPMIAIVGALIALVAVIRDSWRTERWATPIAAGALASYVATAWLLAASETLTRQTQASVVTLAVLYLIYRTVELAAKAAKDRVRHEATTTTFEG